MPFSRLQALNARQGCRSNHMEVVQVARSVDTQCLASEPVPRETLVPPYVMWFYAPSVIALQSACLASQWFSSLMTIGWALMWPVAETREPNGDVIATPGSKVIRVIPAANANSVAPTANTHNGSAEIVAFPRRRGMKQP